MPHQRKPASFRGDIRPATLFANATFIIYADLDGNPNTGRQDNPSVRGTDLMISLSGAQMGLYAPNPVYGGEETFIAGAAVVGSVLYVTLDTRLPEDRDEFPLAVQLLSQRRGGRTDSTPRKDVELPRAANRVAPKVTRKGAPDLRPLSDYRYHDNFVKLERFEDKGITFEQVVPAKPIEFGRPRPEPMFAMQSHKPGKAGFITRQRIEVSLKEEKGIARHTSPLTFGFPLPRGGIFDLGHLRVLSDDGKDVPSQFTATSFWPDDSLKWVLVDLQNPLAANGEGRLIMELARLACCLKWGRIERDINLQW